MNQETRSTCAGDIVAAVALWALWALSVVPLLVLFIEFGHSPQHCVGASYYAKLYGHMFVYPLLFGLPATVFLTQPWLHTVRWIRNLRPPKRGRLTAFLTVCIVGIVSFASWTDFTQATPALWSFKAAVHEKAAQNKTTEMVIRGACETLIARHQDTNEGAAQVAVRRNEERVQENEEGEKPLDILKNGLLDEETRSATEWAYYIGFIGNTMWMALLFGVVVARTGSNDRSQLGHIVLAMALATAWVPFRAAFLVEKAGLYTDPLQPQNYLIFLAFVVLYLHTLRLYIAKGGKGREVVLWTGNLIVAILALLSALVGLLPPEFGGSVGTEFLVDYFGSKSSLLVYITMLLLFLVMVAPAVVRGIGGVSRS